MASPREKKEVGIIVSSLDMQTIHRVIVTRIGGYNEIMSFSAMWDRLQEEELTKELAARGLMIEAYLPACMGEFDWTTNQVFSEDFERFESVYDAMDAVSYDRKKRKFGEVLKSDD